ncbi:TetR/AcrR family transcriptional regulator [Pyruvatibacter sp.]|uniref:TetR/AcrR family transcriptional regulator n=1 Tax=Pyruvatibacter sp. TaxID=1981328 RepID=UPI003265E515
MSDQSTQDQRLKKGAKTRRAIVDAAAELFRRQGYAGTSISNIISQSRQPRGSLYFHFPDGKNEIAHEALTQSADELGDMLEAVFAQSATLPDAVEAICAGFAAQLKASDFQDGCPVSPFATSVDPEQANLRTACGDTYEGWLARTELALEKYGFEKSRRSGLALVLLSAIEGALLLAKASGTTRALDQLPTALAPLLNPASSSS